RSPGCADRYRRGCATVDAALRHGCLSDLVGQVPDRADQERPGGTSLLDDARRDGGEPVTDLMVLPPSQ
ncbi:MAG: hypothetical protein ACRDXB_12875, partial [Actinomycetes bacterium]